MPAQIRLANKNDAAKWLDLLKATKQGQYQFRAFAWGADYPDAENFLQLLYGPNSGQSNDTRFRLAAYDRLYERARQMPDSPERSKIYEDMTRLVLVYAPWKLGTYRVDGNLIHPWVLGYKKHPMIRGPWRFLDVDVAMQTAARQ